MIQRTALVAACLALFSCGDGAPIPAQDLRLEVMADSTDVEFGVAFPLTVVRSYRSDLVPAEWKPGDLAPLSVRVVQRTSRESGGYVEETLHLEARAFSLEDLTLTPAALRAHPRAGGRERVAVAGELTFTVRPALDRAEPGAVELPGEPLHAPAPRAAQWWMAWTAVALAVASAAFVYRRRRRPLRPAPSITPRDRALERVEELSSRVPASQGENQDWYVEASAILREYLDDEFDVPAPERTTEQVLSAQETAAALGAAQRATLATYLAHCDQVKFARHSPAASERHDLLQSASGFLQAAPQGEP